MATKTDARIIVEQPDQARLDGLGVKTWSIWTKEVSEFDWFYHEKEICYFLEGKVTVTTDQGETYIGVGDLVQFPEGLSCKWHVHEPVRKHYKFG